MSALTAALPTEPISTRASRIWAAIACAALIACSVGYLGWIIWPEFTGKASGAQRDAALVPVEMARALAKQLGDVSLFEEGGPVHAACAALFSLVWAGVVLLIGRSAVRRMKLKLFVCEQIAFSAASGLVIVGTLVLMMGLSRLLSPYALATAGLVLLTMSAAELLRLWRNKSLSRLRPAGSASLGIALVPAAVLLALLFCIAALPPIQSDAMRYHLAAPQEFLRMGRIGFLPHNAFSNFPMLLEMHMMLALAAHVPAAAQLMHCFAMLATAIGIVGVGQRLLRAASGGIEVSRNGHAALVIASLLYAFVPAGAVVATWPNIDHATALFALMAAAALLVVWESPSRASYVLLGAMCAGAAATKYTLLVHVALLGIAWAVLVWVQRGLLGRHWRGAAVAVGVFLLFAGPWYIKNVALTGNPVYPLANSIFKGGDWTPECARFYMERAMSKGEAKSVGNFLAAPLNSTFNWFEYESHNPGAATMIAWVIVIGCTGIGRWRMMAKPLMFVALAMAFWVTWYFSYQSNRMLLPFYALLLPVLPVVVAGAPKMLRAVSFIVLMLTAIAGGYWAFQWSAFRTSLSPPALPYLLGATPEETYMARSLGYWRAFEYLNEHVRPGERVFLVGEHRIYGARFDATWSDWFDTPSLPAFVRENHLHSMEQMLSALRSRHFAYVLINEGELAPQIDFFRSRLSEEEWNIFTALDGLNDVRVATVRIPPLDGSGGGVKILHLAEPQ